MKLIIFLCSSPGQTGEDGNNVCYNFNIRATKNHMDLSEEHTKGRFWHPQCFRPTLTVPLSEINISNISLILGWEMWTHCLSYEGDNECPSTLLLEIYGLVMLEILSQTKNLISSKAHVSFCMLFLECSQMQTNTVFHWPLIPKEVLDKGTTWLWFKNIFRVCRDSPRSKAFPKAGFSADFLFCCGKSSQWAIKFFIWYHKIINSDCWQAFEKSSSSWSALRPFWTYTLLEYNGLLFT